MYKGLQDSIRQNRLRSFLLIVLFPGFLYLILAIVLALSGYNPSEGISFAIAWQDGLLTANAILILVGPIILIWGLISFFFHRQMIFSFAGAKPISRKENPEIYNIVENLCISKGLETPRIGIMEDNSLNAFATGRNMKNGRIVFSRGLINKLDKSEIEAVAAHELTHILNKDSLMMIIIVVFIGIIGTLGQILIRASGRSRDNDKAGGIIVLVGLALVILGYLIYPFIRLALSRKREFLADAGSVHLTKNKYSMISALQKISKDSTIESIQKDTIAAMCIETPFKKTKKRTFFAKMLSTHPSIEDRIKAIESY